VLLDGPLDKPLSNGMVWNMVYGNDAAPGVVPSATSEQLWSRLKFFLDKLILIAEEAGVTLGGTLLTEDAMTSVKRV
jgi:mannonate dehydratase